MVLLVGLWTGLLAVGTGIGLVIGQNALMRRTLLSGREAAVVVAGGLAAGLASGALSQAAFAVVADTKSLRFMGQVLGWMLLGGLLAVGMSLFIPNLKRLVAGLGGAVGGLVGVVFFLLANQVGMGETLGRLTGSMMLGAGIGAMVALVEHLARSAFMRVHWEHGQFSRVSLGPKRVLIGSSPQAHVCIPDDSVADIAAAITFIDGRIELHDRVDDHREELRSGQRITYGSVEVEICSEDTAVESPTDHAPTQANQDGPNSPTSRPQTQQQSAPTPATTPQPPQPTPQPQQQSSTVTLVSESGHSIELRIRTRLNKGMLRECGEDAQFADSKFQCELVPQGAGWQIVPNTAAANETLLNGRQLTAPATLNPGDVVSIGREAKGISKLPMTIRF
jgi:hypothetical protein